MDLFFQYGNGMKNTIIDLSNQWGGATAILCPRAIEHDRLESYSEEFKNNNVNLLFDPQYYYDKDDYNKLGEYKYFEKSLKKKEVIKLIKEYNDKIGTYAYIIPTYMKEYSNTWLSDWNKDSIEWIELANNQEKNKDKIFTVALPKEVLEQDDYIIEDLIEKIKDLKVNYYYIIVYSNNDRYLLNSHLWFSNFLKVCAAIKLANKKIIVGYANQQYLLLNICKVDAIASGNNFNVRKFNIETIDEDITHRKKGKWYYCPQCLSEYTVRYLETAYNKGIIDLLKPKREMQNEYSNILFDGQSPSVVNFPQQNSYKHYLYCLKYQADSLLLNSFDDTFKILITTIDIAQKKILELKKQRIYYPTRNFLLSVVPCKNSLEELKKAYGFALTQEWHNI